MNTPDYLTTEQAAWFQSLAADRQSVFLKAMTCPLFRPDPLPEEPPAAEPEPFEPSPEDRAWAAAEFASLDLTALAPIAGGSPCPDERPVKVRSHRANERHPMRPISDRDMARRGAL